MPLYRTYSDYLAEFFPEKMQKLTVNAGFTCPNRDGTKGRGGCIYCNNQSFNPTFASHDDSVTEQLLKGKQFFARKYPQMRYLAYFQAYTNTHSSDIDRLTALYEEALSVPGVDGIIIGTRPDCMPQQLLERLRLLNTRPGRVMVEYGAESSHDATLQLINRCHTWADTVDAVQRTADAGIHCGVHLILGLPGETETMMLETVDRIATLPLMTVKFHQLQVIRGTRLAQMMEQGSVELPHFTVESYLDLCAAIVRRLPSHIAIERFTSQSPDNLLITPRWGLKNYQFTELLRKRLEQT
ncbi:MAG: TIGR01212 family radical SAM protein [Muribaculaceae bacterium]|nr:TIGR01212 family radical SAM protein [Muribaculaceae bacterium]